MTGRPKEPVRLPGSSKLTRPARPRGRPPSPFRALPLLRRRPYAGPSAVLSSRLHLWLLAGAALLFGGCGTSAEGGGGLALRVGGIPDQDLSRLERMFGLMAEYLREQTGLEVRYVASNDYAAIVSAFQRGDVHLAWFGGLTGVQARAVTPGAEALAQRPRDARFRSVFILAPGVQAKSLRDLAGRSFTFGSESSTSGHLMPRHFLHESGLDADADFSGPPGYSGSHDVTYRLVEAGAYQAGVLSEAVWEAAVAGARVDTARVRVLAVTPPYYDYNWSIRGDLDARFGAGTRERVARALYALDASMGAREAELLELFATDRFVPTDNANYAAIREVAEALGIVR